MKPFIADILDGILAALWFLLLFFVLAVTAYGLWCAIWPAIWQWANLFLWIAVALPSFFLITLLIAKCSDFIADFEEQPLPAPTSVWRQEPEPHDMDEPLRLDRERQLVEEARERDRS